MNALPRHSITKSFEFCYGHRVWTQTLNGAYSDNLQCACRHLHGHEAKVDVTLTAPELNLQGFVTDFRHLEFLKRWFNKYVDHRFVVDRNDPLFNTLFPLTFEKRTVFMEVGTGDQAVSIEAGAEFVLPLGTDPLIVEMYEGLLIVDFPPTSENFAQWVLEMVDVIVHPLGCTVERVDWWETPRSRSTYTRPR